MGKKSRKKVAFMTTLTCERLFNKFAVKSILLKQLQSIFIPTLGWNNEV